MSIVCVDTQILSWGIIHKHSQPGNDALVRLCKDFLEWLEKEDKSDVIIPTVVLGELLIPVPEEERADVLSQLVRNWRIVEYDVKSALLFAQMRHEHMSEHRRRELRRLDPTLTRKEIYADVMITATAVAHGADKIYSRDAAFLDIAGQYIEAVHIENVRFQRRLFERDDPEE